MSASGVSRQVGLMAATLGIGHRLFEDVGPEAMLEGIVSDGGLALRRAWSTGRLGIAPVGFDLRLRSHNPFSVSSLQEGAKKPG